MTLSTKASVRAASVHSTHHGGGPEPHFLTSRVMQCTTALALLLLFDQLEWQSNLAVQHQRRYERVGWKRP